MERRTLGGQVDVSAIGLGCMGLTFDEIAPVGAAAGERYPELMAALIDG